MSNEKFMLGAIELDLITRKEIPSANETVLNNVENMDSLKKFQNNEGYIHDIHHDYFIIISL